MPRRTDGWLRLDDLHALDVILSRSRHKRSFKTARAIRGEFSHAAIVLETGMWFDAQPAGCGLYCALAYSEDGGDGASYLNVKRYGNICAFRHPIFDLLTPDRQRQLVVSAEEHCNRLIGSYYARYDALLPLVRAPLVRAIIQRWPKQVTRLAGAVDKLHAIFLAAPGTRGIRIWEAILCGHKSVPGHFCSELVVHLYEKLGLDLVVQGQSTSFRPDDLADPSRSFLRRIEVIRPSMPPLLIPDTEYDWAAEENFFRQSKKMFLRSDADLRTSLSKERIESIVAATQEDLDDHTKARLARLKAGMVALTDEMQRLVELAKNLQDLYTTFAAEHDRVPEIVQRWADLVTKRLTLDDPLRPATAAVVRIGLAEMTENDRAKTPADEKLLKCYADAFGKAEKVHRIALHYASELSRAA